MKALKSRITRALPRRAKIDTCDNSGAKVVQLVSVKTIKTTKGRIPSAGVGDLITAAVVKGNQELRGTLVFAIIVRQRKEYRRADGTRIKFEDNAVVVLKDDKGNPKGTMFKGPIAKEAAERWPGISKIASIVV